MTILKVKILKAIAAVFGLPEVGLKMFLCVQVVGGPFHNLVEGWRPRPSERIVKCRGV